jgi:hypothetical protein
VEKAGQNSPWKSQERFPLFHSSGDDNLSLDDRDLFLENPTASVASLRRLITSIPESRSRSARNTDHLHRNPHYAAEYRSSGVMTFIINEDGVVYQKDLGKKSDVLAKAMKEYNPNSSWQKGEDEQEVSADEQQNK